MLSNNKNMIMPQRTRSSFQKYAIPNPFNMIALSMMINHLAGTIFVRSLRNKGILSIGKINPESRMVGRYIPSMEIIIAVIWLLATVEINIPSDKTRIIKTSVTNISIR
jgi:hypothetical protein